MGNVDRVWVVGLSDIGRSPRLQNHAISLATQAGLQVDVVAYKGSKPLPALVEHATVLIHNVPGAPEFLQQLPRPIGLPLKAIAQAVLLFVMLLFRLRKPSAVLLQVPPAIPTLFLCWLVCWMRGARLIVDWHNFAYTLMTISLGKRHSLVRLASAHERFWGRRAHAHLCVTRAMQTELATAWRIQATVFYDRPPASFHHASLEERHELLLRLAAELYAPMHPHDFCHARPGLPAESAPVNGMAEQHLQEDVKLPDVLDSLWTGSPPGKASSRPGKKSRVPAEPKQATSQEPAEEVTLCTRRVAGAVHLRKDRPALIVSSTSWTPDEDFSILLDAAVQYDTKSRASSSGGYPQLLILVTGRGPQKAMYLERMRGMDLKNVAFRTLWLDPADYPLLLGSCDAGVSLHTSSSGLDLPMKVVDMFGCGLPVFAATYPCISELVRHGENGLHFTSGAQLAQQWAQVFAGFPEQQSSALRQMASAVQEQRGAANANWDSNWREVVLPLFRQI